MILINQIFNILYERIFRFAQFATLTVLTQREGNELSFSSTFCRRED